MDNNCIFIWGVKLLTEASVDEGHGCLVVDDTIVYDYAPLYKQTIINFGSFYWMIFMVCLFTLLCVTNIFTYSHCTGYMKVTETTFFTDL